MMNKPTIYWIDLFCGAGGTSTGIHMADANAKVIACVNHDEKALESHEANHPDCLHLPEDVRDFDKVVRPLKNLSKKLRREDPGCIINIWASLECTNYSKAKGGLPRDEDSRTLANSLFMYIEKLSPNYIYIENVREFMAWGPLDENGKPISRKNGRDYVRWINKMQSFGYDFEYKILNAANFGAFTSRERYFGQFAKKGFPISWPEPTHVKKLPEKSGLFETTKKKWKAVKEVLDLEDEGQSIFTRKKPLVENTLERIYAGLIKFVANGENEFLKHTHGGDPKSKVWSVNRPNRVVTGSGNHYKVKSVFIKSYYSGGDKHRCKSIDEPCSTIRTNNCQAIVSTSFLKKYYSGKPEGKVISIEGPSGAITTFDGHALVNVNLLQSHYGNGSAHSTDKPCPTVTTEDRFAKVDTVFMDQQYGQSKPKSIEDPAGTITVNPKLNVVTTKHHYLMNPQFNSKGSSVENPCPTIIARQDKKPLYIISCEQSKDFGVIIYEDDNETMVKIKEFMAVYGIIDIKMRMLHVNELLRIQGFPEGYQLKGTKTDQKKFIGNAVEVNQAKALIESNYKALENF